MATPTDSTDPADHDPDEARLEQIVREGPVGTWAVAGLAAFLVMLIYVLFYVFAYLPRGIVQ